MADEGGPGFDRGTVEALNDAMRDALVRVDWLGVLRRNPKLYPRREAAVPMPAADEVTEIHTRKIRRMLTRGEADRCLAENLARSHGLSISRPNVDFTVEHAETGIVVTIIEDRQAAAVPAP